MLESPILNLDNLIRVAHEINLKCNNVMKVLFN